jgi:hypothetical protein
MDMFDDYEDHVRSAIHASAFDANLEARRGAYVWVADDLQSSGILYLNEGSPIRYLSNTQVKKLANANKDREEITICFDSGP